MKRTLATLATAAFILSSMTIGAEAGRKGSHRVGGTNSHGKGSHYVGGHTMLESVRPSIIATLCRDGTYSHSNGSGTCSHHGGEA
jgi:hypothetical protein